MEAYFDELISLNPFMATFLGHKHHDNIWVNTLSTEYRRKMDALVRKHAKKEMPVDEKRVFKFLEKDYWEGRKYHFEWMPISSHNNLIIDFDFVNKSIYSKNKTAEIARHYGFMDEIKSMKRNMRLGMKKGLVIPERIRQKLVESIETFVAKDAFISNEYRECVIDFLKFLRDEYKGRESIGMLALPQGREMYCYLVRSYTTLDITPEEIHKLGLKEVARIWRQMRELGLDIKKIVARKSSYYDNVDELLRGYEKIRDEAKLIVEQNFWQQVKPFEVKQVPKTMEATSAGAFYMPPGGKRPGVFYVNTRDFKENPKYNMKALGLHEGIPGHHYQFEFIHELGLPNWRQHAIDSIAFVEGWALYAESLGEYKGEEMLGKLTYEMFRAVRLVVDTGLHYYGWTFDQAVNYMVKYLPAMTFSEIVTEVERYACMPGQAVCYKIGELTIKELRRKWKGDIRDFHQYILEGGILPLEIVKEKLINKLSYS